jgi:hypothetical protein
MPIPRTILVTRPNHDRTTRYISAWAEEVLRVAQAKGDAIFDLCGKRANKAEVVSVAKKRKPNLVFLNGHGNADHVTGQDGELLVSIDSNPDLFPDAIVYALACRAGYALGPVCVTSGTRAFIGYKDDFVFLITPEHRTRPLEDKTAALFLEPSNQVIVSLLRSHTASDAQASARKAFYRNIQKLMTSETSAHDSSAVRFLLWNARNLVCCGDGQSHLA